MLADLSRNYIVISVVSYQSTDIITLVIFTLDFIRKLQKKFL